MSAWSPLFGEVDAGWRARGGAEPGSAMDALAAAALSAASRPGGAEAALLDAAMDVARRDTAGLDGALVAIAACLRALPDHDGVRAALPVARGLDCAAAVARRSERPLADPAAGSPPDALAGEDPEAAEAVIRAALADGASLATMEATLVDALYDGAHRRGHLAPVVLAVVELRALLDSARAAELLARLGRTLILRQRPADPQLDAHRQRCAPLLARADDLFAAANPERASAFQEARFRRALTDGRMAIGPKAVAKAQAYGVPRALLAASLCLAAADRVLRFDPAVARSARQAEGWADMGWLLQVAAASRALQARHDRPGWLGLLLYTTWLIGLSAAFDAAESGRFALPEPASLARTWDHGPEIAKVTGHLLAGDGAEAMACLRGYLLMVMPEQPLCAGLLAAALEDRATTASRQGQRVAVAAAALDAFQAVAEAAHRELLPCAALRLLTAPEPPRPIHATTLARIDRAEGGRPAPVEATLPWRR